MNQQLDHPLNIAFLVQSLDWVPSYQEGASTQVSHILHGLQSAGHKVALLSSRLNKQVMYSADLQNEQPACLTFTKGPGFNLVEGAVRRLQTGLKLPWVQIFDSLRFYDACAGHVKKHNIFYERNSMHGIGAALASKRLKVPYVLHVDADFLLEHDFLGIPHTQLERLIAVRTARYNYQAAHAITCVSVVTKKHLVSNYKVPADKITVIPNGTVIQKPPAMGLVEAKRAELRLCDLPIVMFVGSFYLWHGLDILMQAFKLVLRQMPSAKLVFVGDGQMRPEIENQVQQEGLTEQIIFTGSVAHDQVPVLLSLADVAVAPYPRMSIEFWGSPMKIFEYMGAGKAIVASRVGQIGSVLEHGHTGLLVEPGDVEDTARAILKLLANPELRQKFGEEARRTVEREYTWGKYIEKLEDVYSQAMARAKAEGF